MKKTGLIEIVGYIEHGTGQHQSNTVYAKKMYTDNNNHRGRWHTADKGIKKVEKKRKKIGSLIPDKDFQDRVNVWSRGGVVLH